jgi:hypothetical protein
MHTVMNAYMHGLQLSAQMCDMNGSKMQMFRSIHALLACVLGVDPHHSTNEYSPIAHDAPSHTLKAKNFDPAEAPKPHR